MIHIPAETAAFVSVGIAGAAKARQLLHVYIPPGIPRYGREPLELELLFLNQMYVRM